MTSRLKTAPHQPSSHVPDLASLEKTVPVCPLLFKPCLQRCHLLLRDCDLLVLGVEALFDLVDLTLEVVHLRLDGDPLLLALVRLLHLPVYHLHTEII